METLFASDVPRNNTPRFIGKIRARSWAIAVAGAMALTSGLSSAAETTFTGFTDGCFGAGCTPVASSGAQSATLAGLTYNDSTFSSTTSAGFLSIGAAAGSGNTDNLGSFTLTGAPFNYTGNAFDLLVTFTAPAGVTPNPSLFTSVILGSVTSSDNGGVFIDFDNTRRHLTFGSGNTAGAFDFWVNDLSITPGQSVSVSGSLIATVAAVPEPETYALMLSGLGLMGFIARRRKNKDSK